MILNLFCENLDKKINKENENLFFSKNIYWRVKEAIIEKCDFQNTEDLDKYLGVYLSFAAKQTNTWFFVGYNE